MIQFNLLPDVKLDYIRTEQRKRAIMALSSAITLSAIALLVVTFTIANIWQKKALSDLDKDISATTKKLEEIPDIDKILTIQNQLNSLPEMHAKKPVASRLFTYLPQLTPAQVTISQMKLDFNLNTMILDGGADKIENINKYADTLKFTQFSTTATPEPQKAFTDVVLTNFGRDESGATYTINLVFNPAIFSSDSDGLQLVVPKTITTRSETERPTELFKQPVNPPPVQETPRR